MKRALKLGLATVALLGALAGEAQAAPIYFFGTDPSGSTTNAANALAAWQASVASFSLDDMTGLTVAADNLSASTTAGTTFTTVDDLFFANTFSAGVISGVSLEVDRDGLTTFTWNLNSASTAFGFNAFDADAGTLAVTFVDGTTWTQSFNTASGGSDSSFLGVSGLNSAVASVTIETNDPGGITNFDNFYSGQSLNPVPEPATVTLFGIGAAVMAVGAIRRRRQKQAD